MCGDMRAVGGEDGLKRQGAQGHEQRELELRVQVGLGLFKKDDLACRFLLRKAPVEVLDEN